MGVVIVQSKATAHVYRMFGALVALLLMMGLAVGLMRLRADRSGPSPYGGLDAVAPVATVPPEILAVPARVAAQGTPQSAAAALAAAAPPPTTAMAFAAPPPTSPTPSATLPEAPPTPSPAAAVPALPSASIAAPPPAPKPAMAASVQTPAPAPTAQAQPPRSIALDRAAAGSAVPQAAPAAAVEAATRTAAAASRAQALAPRRDASLTPADVATDDQTVAAKPSNGTAGRININTAPIDVLNNIPGGGRIGRTIARHRPYRSLQDLVDHRVLKARDFARIRAAISID